VRLAPAGTALALTRKDASGGWLQTDEGLWVFAALVEGAPTSLGVVGVGSAPAVGDAPQRSGGGMTVPVAAPASGGNQWPEYTCTENPSPPPDPACPLKGNISSGGQIYQSPGQRNYCKTVIDTSEGEGWFCSAEEAVTAGWRAAQR
jgi:hypothetical protein